MIPLQQQHQPQPQRVLQALMLYIIANAIVTAAVLGTVVVDGLHLQHYNPTTISMQYLRRNNNNKSISLIRSRAQQHDTLQNHKRNYFNNVGALLQQRYLASPPSLSSRYTNNPCMLPILQSIRTLRGGSIRNSRTLSRYSSSNSNTENKSISNAIQGTSLLQELMMEMFGTFLIVQLGTGAIMSAIFMSSSGGIAGLGTIACVWSIAISIAIYCTSNFCSAHFNPAITIIMYLYRSFHGTKVLPYIISQFIGAMMASYVNLLLYNPHIQQYETLNKIVRSSLNAIPSAKVFGEYYIGVSTLHAFLVEVFGTFILSSVICNVTHPKNTVTQTSKWMIPPIIGSTVGVLICYLAPITQCGLNPARDFGPRLVSYLAGWKLVAFYPSLYQCSLVYIIGPILGAILGATYIDRILLK